MRAFVYSTKPTTKITQIILEEKALEWITSFLNKLKVGLFAKPAAATHRQPLSDVVAT